jgi:hypothetical protein
MEYLSRHVAIVAREQQHRQGHALPGRTQTGAPQDLANVGFY